MPYIPRKLLFFLLALCVTGPPRFLEAKLQENVTLEGTAQDPQARPVPGATVELRSPGTGFRATAITDAQGRFRLEGIPAGTYRLTARVSGLESRETEIVLQSSRSGLVIDLDVAGFAQEVSVTASMPELATEITVPGGELGRRGAQDVGQALRDEPGLFSARRGAINMEPNVRGLQENQIGMFVDGTRTFAAGPARMDSDLSHVSPRALQSMRVVKGPYALTWGAGTLSAIELETFRPDFGRSPMEPHGRVGFQYGSNGDLGDGHVGVWGASQRLRFTGFFSGRLGSDYKDGDDNLIPGDYQSYDSRWDMGWQAGANTVIEYSGGYQEQRDIDFPGRILDATFFKTQSHALELTLRREGGPIDEVYAQFFLNDKEHLMNNDEKPTAQPMPGRVPPFGLRVDLPTSSDTLGGRAYVASDRGSWYWKAGLDFYDLDQSAERSIFRRDNGVLLFRDIVWPDANTKDFGFYGQAIREWDRGSVGATVRLDAVRVSAGTVSSFFLENTTGPLDQDETHPSFAVSGNYELQPGWILTAGLGRAVRTATTLERYSDRFPSTKFQVAAEFMGNPALEPEKSVEINIGSAASAGGVRIEGDFFYRRIADYITVMPDPDLPRRLPLSPPVVFRYINGDANFWGYELGAQGDLGQHAAARGSLSYVRGEDETFDEPAFGMPPLELRLAAQFHSADRRRWVELSVTSVAEQDRVASARLEVPTPGWTTVDLLGAIQFEAGWAIRLGVQNIAGKQYATHLNALNPFLRERVPEPGRSLIVGLEYDF